VRVNKWLERALISAAASVVSTTAIVTTAERPNKPKEDRSNKDRSNKDRSNKRGRAERGKDGVRIQEEVPRSMGAQAAHDFRAGHDGGLTPLELLENLKAAGRTVGSVGGYLLGRGKNRPPPVEQTSADVVVASPPPPRPPGRRKKVRKKVRRKKGTGDPAAARAGEPISELRELSDEAFKRVSSAAARRAAEKVGVAGAVDSLKESELWKKTGAFGRRVKERFPEDIEKVGDSLEGAGKSLADNAKRLSERVKKAAKEAGEREGLTPHDNGEPPSDEGKELGARLERGVKGIARWMEGPGAPGAGPSSSAGRVRPQRADGGAVEAKEPGTGEPVEVVEAKDPLPEESPERVEAKEPSPEVVQAKEPPDVP
jgi:hypothetical protein